MEPLNELSIKEIIQTIENPKSHTINQARKEIFRRIEEIESIGVIQEYENLKNALHHINWEWSKLQVKETITKTNFILKK